MRLQRGRAAFVRSRFGPARAADDPVERLRRAPVLLLAIGRELERDDRNGQIERPREARGIVLQKFGRAGCADDDRLRPEALVGVADRGLEDLRRVRAEIARLEGRIGDRRPLLPPLDHGEEKIGVGVALRRVQDEVHALHPRHDADRADMRRAFVGPEREVHR